MSLPLWTEAGQRALYANLGYRTGHAEQERFLYDWSHRWHVVRCPARASKSYTAAKKALPIVLGRAAKPDGTGPVPTTTWIVGPTYDLAEPEFMYLWDDIFAGVAAGWWPRPAIARNTRKGGELVLVMPWGSAVLGKSSDKPQSLLGKAVDCIIMAEAAQQSRDIWEKYLQPRLSTTQGYALFPTTPEERATWLYELDQAGTMGDPDIAAYTWPVTGNPAYPIEEFERAKRHYGEAHPAFREQYLGEWTFWTGTVYSQDFDPHRNVIAPYTIPLDWPRIRAIDFGHRDPFVCKWYAITSDGGLDCYREYYQPGRDLVEHAEAIRELTRDEPVWYTVADPSEPQQIADLARYGVPCRGAIRERRPGRLAVAEAFRTGRLRYVRDACPQSLRELRQYKWAPDRDREGGQERTAGDDHAMDCDRYAVMTRARPKTSPSVLRPGTFAWELRQRTRARHQAAWARVAGV